MVNLTIDGKTIEVPEGTTVLRAAQMADIHIPTLCDHPSLTPYGGCRMCLVEIEGMRGLQPSCTLPATNNMVVSTDTEKLRTARKFVLTLIFSERNHFCPYCQVSGGDCELQNAAYYEGMTHWPLQPNWQRYDVDASHPYFILESNRCILCRRCVRACGELVGNFTLGFEARGANSILVADIGTPLGESTCISCGMCVQVCPTGALIDRWSAYRGRETDIEHHKTICTQCDVGCGIDILTRDNKLVRIEGDWDAPINRGVICKYSRFVPMEEDRQRLITPLVRKNDSLKATTWDDAIDLISNQMKPFKGKKENGLTALVSARMPTEVLSLFKHIFSNYFNSDLVTCVEEDQISRAMLKVADENGKSFETKIEDINQADCIVTIGVDLVENHQVAGFFVKRVISKGAKLVVIDPKSHPWDQIADATLKFKKGTNLDILQGLSAAVVKLGLAKEKSTGQLDLTLKTATEKTGIASEDYLKVAAAIAMASHPIIIYGKNLSTDNTIDDTCKSLLEFARLIGALDKNSSCLVSVKGQANSVAAAQYQLDKPIKLYGTQVAYVILGDDLPSESFIKSLEQIPFLIVQSSYASKLTAMADVVLPVENWIEMEGHYVSMDGRLQKANRAIQPSNDIWANEVVLKSVADRLGIDSIIDWQKQLNQRVSPVSIEKI